MSILPSLIDLKSANPLIASDSLLSALTDVQYIKFLKFEIYTKLKILCEWNWLFREKISEKKNSYIADLIHEKLVCRVTDTNFTSYVK